MNDDVATAVWVVQQPLPSANRHFGDAVSL